MGAPIMYDADGKASADIAVTMVQSKKTVEVTYTPNAEWLSAEERVYQVIIDPELVSPKLTSNITDLSFYALDMNAVEADSLYLKFGLDYYDYVKFNTLPTILPKLR